MESYNHAEKSVYGRYIFLSVFFVFMALSFPVNASTEHTHKVLSVENLADDSVARVIYSYRQEFGQHITIDDVANLPVTAWQSPSKHAPNFGYTHDTYWFKFTLVAPTTSSAGRFSGRGITSSESSSSVKILTFSNFQEFHFENFF